MERLNAYRGRNDPKAASGFEKDRVVLARGVRIDQIASLCPSLHLRIQGAHLHRVILPVDRPAAILAASPEAARCWRWRVP